MLSSNFLNLGQIHFSFISKCEDLYKEFNASNGFEIGLEITEIWPFLSKENVSFFFEYPQSLPIYFVFTFKMWRN